MGRNGKRRQPRTLKQRRERTERRAAARQRCAACRAGVARALARVEPPAMHWCPQHRPKGRGLAEAVAAWEREQVREDRAIGRLAAYSGIGWSPDAAMRICAALAPIFAARAEARAEAEALTAAEQFAEDFEASKRRIFHEWKAEGMLIRWKDRGSREILSMTPIEPDVPGWVRSKTERGRWDLGHTSISVAAVPGNAPWARAYEIRVYTRAGTYRDPAGRRYMRIPAPLYLKPNRLRLQVTQWAKRHGLHATGWRVGSLRGDGAHPISPALTRNEAKRHVRSGPNQPRGSRDPQ